MGKRRKAREAALQILFQTEFNDNSIEKIQSQFWIKKKVDLDVQKFSQTLVKNVLAHKDEIDGAIQSVSEHWRVSRMTVIDRCILRIGVAELLFGEDIASAVIINEAIEIAKKFSSTEAAHFINGILDAVKNTQRENMLSEGEKND